MHRQFESDLDRRGRYACETVVAGADEVRVVDHVGRVRVTLPRSRVTGFEVESYVSSGALYACVDGTPHELVRFTNSLIPTAAAFARALSDNAPSSSLASLPPTTPSMTGDSALGYTRWSVFRRAMRFAPRAPVKLVLVVAALLLHTGANVATPYLAGTVFFDRVLQPTDALFGQVGLLVAMIALVRLAELSFRIVWGWNWGSYHHRTGLSLRSAVFAGVHRLSLSFFSNNHTGTLLTHMNTDMNGVGSLLGATAPNGFVQAVIIAGSLTAMAVLDLRLAGLALIALPLYVWIVHRVEPALAPGVSRGYRAERAVTAAADDSFMGTRVVRAFGGEPQERARFRRTNEWAASEEFQRVALTGTVFPLGELLLQVGLLLVWAAGAWWVIGGTVSFGVLIGCVGYLTLMWEQLGSAGAVVGDWIYATSGMHRMVRILDARPTVVEPRDAGTRTLRGDVRMQQVTFGYEPNKPVLHAVDIHAAAGEMIGLVGQTGAGKSTIVNLVTRLYDVDEGTVLLDGVDVRNIATADMRRQIGIVLQDPYLFTGSVADNIRYAAPDAAGADVIAAAEVAHAHEFIVRLPEGYDTIIGQGGHGLSGGEQQRLAIARAVLLDPPVLILDEATSSVDTETELHIQQALARLVSGRTTIAIAHRLSTLRQVDRLYVVDHGRVVERGSHNDLMAARGVYHRLVQTQLRALHAIAIGE